VVDLHTRERRTTGYREGAMSIISRTDLRRLEFVAAAHDLRNRLSTARCQVAQLRISDCDASFQDSLKCLSRALSRTNALLEQFLELSGDELRLPETTACQADIVDVARRLIAQEPYRSCHRNVTVLTTLSGLTGPWDARRLTVVLQLLLENAIAYSPGDLPVEIEITTNQGCAALAVRDRGRGICPEDLPNVFEPFYRGHNASGTAGLGLGLPTARLIVEQYAGVLDVESTEGVGSSFTVRLPLK
jgi:signal transduction histidine kinase